VATIEARCKVALDTQHGARLSGVIVFGSAVRHQDTPESDLDLLVLLKEPFDYFEELRTITDLLYPVQLESDRLISAKPAPVHAFEAGTIQLYRNVKREGLRL
jgi:predicted nucleotidyltransferase